MKRGSGLEPRDSKGSALKPPVFSKTPERASVESRVWAAICDQVAAGEARYSHLLFLQRVVVEDLDAIYEALKNPDVKIRWNRLWVSAPTLARLARRASGALKVAQLLGDDLGALHILARFRSDKTPAVRRLFQRIHADILPDLIGRLWEERSDLRKAGALSEIIGQIERRADVLRDLATARISPTAWDLLAERLELREDPTKAGFGRGSSGSIRDVLQRFALATANS